MESKVGLHSRALLQVTVTLDHINKHLMKLSSNTCKCTGIRSPPLFDEEILKKIIPFTSDLDVHEFFEIRSKETAEDTQHRVSVLQNYILETEKNCSQFVYRMVRLICSEDYRRTHFYPGRKV